MASGMRKQDLGMEPTGKIVEYCAYAWKLALPSIGKIISDDDDDDDDGDEDDVYDEDLERKSRNEGYIINVLPFGTEQQSYETTWQCRIRRTFTRNSNGRESISVTVSNWGSDVFIKGFYKISIIDQAGNILPGQMKYAHVGTDTRDEGNGVNGFSVNFEEMQLSGNSEDKLFVCFELHIEVDERETTEFIRSTNDLSLLLDESLLTDSVLRVSGREISVHRAVLAARWPRFYGKFLAGSKDSTVNVGEIELEVFEKLLKSTYSNRISTSFLQEHACKDMEQFFEPIWLFGGIQTRKRQHSIPSPTNIAAVNLDEVRDSNPDDIHQIRSSAQMFLRYQYLSYNFVSNKETLRQTPMILEEIFNTIFHGEDGEMITATWKISLKEMDDFGYYGDCRLKLTSINNASSVIAQIQLSVSNGKGNEEFESTQFNQFEPNSEKRFHLDSKTMIKFRSRSLIPPHLALIPPHLDKGDMTIGLDFDILVDDLDGQSRNTISSDDLGNLLVDGHLSDVVLRVGDRKFPVHRAILAARSPVFRAMFTSDMKESVAEEIQIEDMEPDVMKEVLKCVYSDQIPVECGCDMLIAFDRFGLISLFDRCQDKIEVTDENALDVFAIAQHLNAKHLKLRILKFLTDREKRQLHETN